MKNYFYSLYNLCIFKERVYAQGAKSTTRVIATQQLITF